MRIVVEEVRKMIKIVSAYPIEIAFWIFAPLLWVLPLVFQGMALAGGLNSVAFKKLAGTGDFIPFVIVGAIVSTYMFSAVWGMGNSLREEIYYGTLEHILSSPSPKIYILLGKALFESMLSTLFVCIQLLICICFFGIRLTLVKIAPILLFLILLLAGLYGIGTAVAGLTVALKETHGIFHCLESVLYLFSPIRYPVTIHPVTRIVSAFIPLTYALVALRGIILDIPVNLWRNALFLLAIDCIIVPLGFFLFQRVDKSTRLKGTLSHY
ncbi:MAG: ABC transporter permease [bacterium]|nr:ABC transporter permease [bacterium]